MTEVGAIAAKYGIGYGGRCFACQRPFSVIFSAGDFAILCSCGAVTEMRRDGGVFVELPKTEPGNRHEWQSSWEVLPKTREQRESPSEEGLVC